MLTAVRVAAANPVRHQTPVNRPNRHRHFILGVPMKKQLLMISSLIGVLSLSVGLTLAADRAHPNESGIVREPVCRSQRLPPYEKAAYHAERHPAKNPKEQEQICLEQRKQIQERAKARGVTLPNESPSFA